MPTTRSKGLQKDDLTNQKQSTSIPETRKSTSKSETLATKPKTHKRTSKSKTSATNSEPELLSSVAESCLFKLPPELRNTIYRFAVVTDDEVCITKSGGISEPSLLLICKTVRSEALDIFYQENSFSCVVHDYDPASVMLAMRKIASLELRSTPGGVKGIDNFGFRCFREPNWKNLVQWVRLCNEGVCAGFKRAYYTDIHVDMLIALFSAVVAIPELTASGVDILLESMRPVLVDLDDRWAED